MRLLTLSLILFLIMDPVGHVKQTVYLLLDIDPKRQRQIILRELMFALGFMLFFDLVGEYLFSLLQISDPTIYLASGIILFLGAIKILFPGVDDTEAPKPNGEPFLVPLAIPMIAGPALLATIMLYSVSEPNVWISLAAIFIAWLLGSAILLHSRQLLHYLGSNGLTACEKLMGMVLVLLSVQRFMEGVHMLYSTIHAT